MALTDINSEDRLVQQTFANHLDKALGWEDVYVFNEETSAPRDMLGRASKPEAALVSDALLPRLMTGKIAI